MSQDDIIPAYADLESILPAGSGFTGTVTSDRKNTKGIFRVQSWRNGLLHGKSTKTDYNLSKVSLKTYHYGIPHGPFDTFLNGKPVKIGTFRYGSAHGSVEYFSKKDGHRKSTLNFNNGLLHGRCTWFDKEGNKSTTVMDSGKLAPLSSYVDLATGTQVTPAGPSHFKVEEYNDGHLKKISFKSQLYISIQGRITHSKKVKEFEMSLKRRRSDTIGYIVRMKCGCWNVSYKHPLAAEKLYLKFKET